MSPHLAPRRFARTRTLPLKRIRAAAGIVMARIVVGLLSLSLIAGPVRAQSGDVGVVRDTEVEAIIRTFALPIWRVAGLEPSSIHIILINDRTLNAFVANGQNLFLNTGLLVRAETANQLVGVIAHESGHMAGGHLARLPDAMRQAMVTSILGALLGVLAGVSASRSGGGDAAGVLATGASNMAQRNFFSFTRAIENSADRAGATFLDAANLSSRGFLKFMEILQGQEFMQASQQEPYMRTHPLTRERIEFLRNHVETSRHSDAPTPAGWDDLDQRMRAKLSAFLDPPTAVLGRYRADDPSVPARYARAIALYRIPDLAAAIPAIDALMRDFPKDPYFAELKGQMLLENGRIAEALPAYRKAVELAPDAPLIRADLAQVMLQSNDPALLKPAISNLQEATRREPSVPNFWRQMAIAYGRDNQIGLAASALAEEAILSGRTADARDQARRAQRLLPAGSPGWLRAQDIETEAMRERKEEPKQ